MDVQSEAAAPGQGRSGGMILAVNANAQQDTPDSRTWQVWPDAPRQQRDALAATWRADIIDQIAKAARMIAIEQEIANEVTADVKAHLATITEARDGRKRVVAQEDRFYFRRVADDAAKEAGRRLGLPTYETPTLTTIRSALDEHEAITATRVEAYQAEIAVLFAFLREDGSWERRWSELRDVERRLAGLEREAAACRH